MTVSPDIPTAEPGSLRDDFGPLHTEVRAAGLLEARPDWYLGSMLVTAVLGLVVIGWMLSLGSSWWQLMAAAAAGILTARTAFFGHDAGHQQICRSRQLNRTAGLILGNLCTGMSRVWWVTKHNKHHAHPNDIDRDPDVAPGPIVWTAAQAEGRRGRFGRWLARNQARIYVPMLLEGVNLKVSSIRDLWGRPDQGTEKWLLAAHYAAYAGFLFAVMTPGQAIAFVAVHQAVLGLHLGSAFAPNHKGMPMPGRGERWGHFRQQVLTSRNVRGGAVTDWLLGGLNYQIEHHLFPSMPRPHLRLAQPIVRRHCATAGLPYTEESARRSYARAFGHLAEVGRTAEM